MRQHNNDMEKVMRPSFLRMRFLGFTGALVLLLALQTSYAIAPVIYPVKWYAPI
ncbi:hypothetical protein P886_0982 [Alteromonadaceae bacterium 2753L.S.0a.02]|nr:hypothetical protein P886_0982 [Alteromonadaceae bacterium 2753L.S.0a.02]